MAHKMQLAREFCRGQTKGQKLHQRVVGDVGGF